MATFKVSGYKTWYDLEAISAQDAADHGCPGATHVMVGKHAATYGNITITSGRPVRVPQAGGDYGIHIYFTSWDEDEMTLTGHVLGTSVPL